MRAVGWVKPIVYRIDMVGCTHPTAPNSVNILKKQGV
jgi:hypothetical protein